MYQFMQLRFLLLGPMGFALAMAPSIDPDCQLLNLPATIQRMWVLGEFPNLPVGIQRKLVLSSMVESQVEFVLGTRARRCDTTFAPAGMMVSFYPDANLAVWYSAEGKVTSALKSTAEEVRSVTGEDPGVSKQFFTSESSIVIPHPKKK